VPSDWVGRRIRVPLGKRSVVAIIVAINPDDPFPIEKLKAAGELLDDTPLLTPVQQQLFHWASDYYLHPPGEVFALGLSPRERRGEPPATIGQPGFCLNLRGKGLPEGALRRAPKQAALLNLLQSGPRSTAEIEAQGIQRSIVRALQQRDLIEHCIIEQPERWHAHPGLTANEEQAQAIRAITAALTQSPPAFHPFLLDGVTGSGKTEVYLQAIAHCLAHNRQALVLLPEIGLTPQTLARFRARFDAPIITLHSGLADSERDRGWAAARVGKAAIIIGTRSAIFAPIAQLGVIIVDEEHDGSYSQQDGMRYSGRDMAIKRAQLERCPVILGSATPSLETLHNTLNGRYTHLTLSQRALTRHRPNTRIIDVRGLALTGGMSPTLLKAIEQTLKRDEQVLLFLNRRGFAPSLLCHDCGWVAQCHQCDARMTVHRQPPSLCCHHCNHRKALPMQCPSCKSKRLVSSGMGTEQTEQVLHRHFPAERIFRVDSDAMSTRSAMDTFRKELNTLGRAIVLGTQMLSKGHDFPLVTLAAIIDVDNLLFNPDFRGEERLLQLVTQVAGRAGRSERMGSVLLQTHHPDHPLLHEALNQPYDRSATQLLELRRQRALPPFTALAALRTDSRHQEEGLSFLAQIAQQLSAHNHPHRIIGPFPAAMSRRAGLFRAQLLFQGGNRSQLHPFLAKVVSLAESLRAPPGLNWFIDVDPVETL
jgi:primosomal protein N' (replication factor Y)